MTTTVQSRRGLDRLVNFSDATVAIAITLLLLPLVDVASDARHGDVVGILERNHGTIVAFFVSFAVIARMWTLHHRLFEVVCSYNPLLLRVNFVWLASIAFLPFTSNLIASAGQGPGPSGLYISTIACASLTLALMEAIVLHDAALHREAARTALRPANSWLTFGTLLVALALAVLIPGTGVWWLLLLIPAGWVSDYSERRSRRTTELKH